MLLRLVVAGERQLAEKIARRQDTYDDFTTLGGLADDLDGTALDDIDGIAGITGQIYRLAAFHLQHMRVLLDLPLLRIGQPLEQPESLEVPERGMIHSRSPRNIASNSG